MARSTQKQSLVDPASLIEAAASDEGVEIPTFKHEVTSKAKGITLTFDAPVVKKCAQTGRWHVTARINEEGVYVKDNTFFGNDISSKDGFYRIDKEADKDNQSKWRKERDKALKAAAAEVEAADEAPEAPKAVPARSRSRKQVA